MVYSSSLSDREWEILEPLLPEILPQKKRTRPLNWTKREILDGILYLLKNGCNWEDLPLDLPPYSTVYWHYKQWRAARSIEKLMKILHERVRTHIRTKSNFFIGTRSLQTFPTRSPGHERLRNHPGSQTSASLIQALKDLKWVL